MPKKKITSMKAVVLGAGMGSRLSEITRHIPKTMIRIHKKYIFETIIESLAEVGIGEIVFVVGYKRNELIPLIKKTCKNVNVKIKFVSNPRYKETNTMYSLWLARDHLNSSLLYLHGDLIFSVKMLEEFLMSPSRNAILVDRSFPLDWDDAMKVISHKDKIKYISKAITVHEMDGVAIGIYKFDKRGVDELFCIVDRLIKKGVKKSWISEAMNILSKSVKIKAEFNRDHPWVDVDNLSDFNIAHEIWNRIENE